MNRPRARSLLISAPLLFLVMPATGQDAPTAASGRGNGLNVFLDCHTRCESDHFRREIPFVNWVRDREVADVHVLVTAQSTGGGREYRFTFIGLDEYEGRSDTLRYASSSTDVRDEQRDGQTRTLQMGLMRYVAHTPAADRIEIRYAADEQGNASLEPEDDPWNYWVFRVGANGSVESESEYREYGISGNIMATRTTEDWKFFFYGRGEYGEERYTVDDDSVSVYSENTFLFSSFLIRNLSAHWGTGVRASVENSIRYNHDLAVRFGPGIEYSVFPYTESTRRALTFLYSVGVAGFDYEEVTMFNKNTETVFRQALEVSVGLVQPWGNVGASLEGSTYLHDPALHRIDFGAHMNIRLVRGLRFNWWGGVARIKDQIYLSGSGIPVDERLLQRRALGTDFEIDISFGLTYTFGSIFNNVVNPTMDDFR